MLKAFAAIFTTRFVADVFLGSEGVEAQAVADGGVYLNQLLLDLGAAERF
ncbi:MAG: hypothetical protein KA100_03935 [Rickettsiales bacterium]|nr:hypothetical protein [Rickettsiales bacterium]